MLDVPALPANPALELVAAPGGAAPVQVLLEHAPATPETPAARAELAVALAFETALYAFTVAHRQRGIDPVLVIATADSTAGRNLIDKRFGCGIVEHLTGPMAFALSEVETAQIVGMGNWQGLARAWEGMKRTAAEPRFLLAVNAAVLDPRVLREKHEPAEQRDQAVRASHGAEQHESAAATPAPAPVPDAPAPAVPSARRPRSPSPTPRSHTKRPR
jgi:hypothetical protein